MRTGEQTALRREEPARRAGGSCRASGRPDSSIAFRLTSAARPGSTNQETRHCAPVEEEPCSLPNVDGFVLPECQVLVESVRSRAAAVAETVLTVPFLAPLASFGCFVGIPLADDEK